MKSVAAVFLFVVMFASAAPVSAQQILCFEDIDCPDTATCEDRGTYVGGRGVCQGLAPAESRGVINNPLEADSLQELLLMLLRGVVRIGAIALLLFLIFVGFKFVAAQGNEEKIREARGALLWTVIGGAVLLGAEGIFAIIESTANALQ